MTEEEKHLLREAGHEYGAATGRPRRVGPFDVVASRYGVQCQGCDELALTLFDVLDYMEEVPVVAQYKLADGTVTDRFPTGKTLDDEQPVAVRLVGEVELRHTLGDVHFRVVVGTSREEGRHHQRQNTEK